MKPSFSFNIVTLLHLLFVPSMSHRYWECYCYYCLRSHTVIVWRIICSSSRISFPHPALEEYSGNRHKFFCSSELITRSSASSWWVLKRSVSGLRICRQDKPGCWEVCTTEKVDGATSIHWFIMAPCWATFWELDHLLPPKCMHSCIYAHRIRSINLYQTQKFISIQQGLPKPSLCWYIAAKPGSCQPSKWVRFASSAL